MSAAAAAVEPRPWRRAALWIGFLGPFFFLTYGLTNWISAQRADVGALVFDWERNIPFVPAMIVPYMSIDLFYAASVFLCRTRDELDTHGRRLIAATAISITGFLLFPLRFTFERPAVDGIDGSLFALLTSFDQPYNQAPSLHVSLLLILWIKYAEYARGAWRAALHIWFALVLASVVLTYQHHVIDVITGFWAGALCIYVVPDHPVRWRWPQLTADPPSRRIGLRYTSGAALAAAIAFAVQSWAWWLLWPASAMLAVAIGYLGCGPVVFQKDAGRHRPAARLVLLPYLAGAWISQRLHTRGEPAWHEIADGVRIGRLPRAGEIAAGQVRAVLDLTAEFASLAATARGTAYLNLPVMDLTTPAASTLRAAVEFIERERCCGPVLVHCALGRGRSAGAVATWLLATGRAASAREAFNLVAQRWPGIVWRDADVAAIEEGAARGLPFRRTPERHSRYGVDLQNGRRNALANALD